MVHVSLVSGRPGRHGDVDQKFRTIDVISSSTGKVPDAQYVASIMRAVQNAPESDFTGDVYTVSAVLLDTSSGVHSMSIPIARASSSPGFVFGRTKSVLSEIVSKTHDRLSPKERETCETKVYLAKFEAYGVILVFPREMAHHDLLNQLGLAIDSEHGIVAVEVRLCCGSGLGRSKPMLSYSKFEFLFPGVKFERTAARRKRGREDNVPLFAPAPQLRTPPASIEELSPEMVIMLQIARLLVARN